MPTASDCATHRFYTASHPSERSWDEETLQVWKDYTYHQREAEAAGRHGFYHKIEAGRLLRILERRIALG